MVDETSWQGPKIRQARRRATSVRIAYLMADGTAVAVAHRYRWHGGGTRPDPKWLRIGASQYVLAHDRDDEPTCPICREHAGRRGRARDVESD